MQPNAALAALYPVVSCSWISRITVEYCTLQLWHFVESAEVMLSLRRFLQTLDRGLSSESDSFTFLRPAVLLLPFFVRFDDFFFTTGCFSASFFFFASSRACLNGELVTTVTCATFRFPRPAFLLVNLGIRINSRSLEALLDHQLKRGDRWMRTNLLPEWRYCCWCLGVLTDFHQNSHCWPQHQQMPNDINLYPQ